MTNAMTLLVNPGISCCRVKRTSAFWKCHETFETSYQWLVPGLWYTRPFRGYAWLRNSPRQVWWAPLWQDLWPRPLRPLWPWPTRDLLVVLSVAIKPLHGEVSGDTYLKYKAKRTAMPHWIITSGSSRLGENLLDIILMYIMCTLYNYTWVNIRKLCRIHNDRHSTVCPVACISFPGGDPRSKTSALSFLSVPGIVLSSRSTSFIFSCKKMWPTWLRLKSFSFHEVLLIEMALKSVWTLHSHLHTFPLRLSNRWTQRNPHRLYPSMALAFDPKHLQRNEAIGHGAQIHEGSNPFIHVNDFGIVDLAFPWWHRGDL